LEILRFAQIDKLRTFRVTTAYQETAMKPSNCKTTRRAMLVRCAQTAAFAAAAGRVAPLLAAPKSRTFKIGACDWSLGKRCDPTAFDLAKTIGLDGVQIEMGTVRNDMHLRRPEVQQRYRDAAKRTGLQIASLAIGELNNIPLKRDPRAAQWLADSIDVCTALGLTITMPACFATGDLDMGKTAEIDHLVGVLKDVAPKAEKRGVMIGLENYLSAEDNMRIIDRVGSPAIKVYYDVGNSTDKGRDILQEIRTLGKLICEFHAKDAGYMLGQGRIDFHQVRKALDDINYSGWIQLEAAAPHGLIVDYTADRKYLKSNFPSRVD
jgi:L-ribulose-5-phosphate 3-epimerase